MNYFGLFFSFMFPGIILGVMAAVAIHQEAKSRARRARSNLRRMPAQNAPAPRDRLYVHDMNRAA